VFNSWSHSCIICWSSHLFVNQRIFGFLLRSEITNYINVSINNPCIISIISWLFRIFIKSFFFKKKHIHSDLWLISIRLKETSKELEKYYLYILIVVFYWISIMMVSPTIKNIKLVIGLFWFYNIVCRFSGLTQFILIVINQVISIFITRVTSLSCYLKSHIIF